ncbi:MAG: zinc-dependent alcohol dehydrogenase [Acidimicrobiales bacterium]
MKAAIVRALGSPLDVTDTERPKPAPHQVLVRLETSGLCHTDIHAARGEWPVKPTPPFIPGHEGVGIVSEVGVDVDVVEVGARVAVPWLGSACGHCDHCVSGWETLCESQVNTGYGVDGCFAEFVVADARFVVVVPEGIDPLDAAPLTCAGVTTYKAVKMAGARPATRVAVFGIGGLGHLAVQYAALAGAEVIAVDVTEPKLAMAKRLGATHAVNASKVDPAEEIQRLGGAHAVVSTAVTPAAIESAFRSLRRNGRLVLVGLPADNEISVPVFETVLGGISIIGSIVGTRQDLREVFELHAAGLTEIVRESRRLDDVNSCIDEVLSGEVTARLVFDLRDGSDA